MKNEIGNNKKMSTATIMRKWSRLIHRDVSYFFAGILIIYCISGIYMNHRDKVNVHYNIERIEFQSSDYPAGMKMSESGGRALLGNCGLADAYTKRY